MVKIIVKPSTRIFAELLMKILSQPKSGSIGNIKNNNEIIVTYNAN